jgi:G:T-mismatch repair DNA endonuclease (very short patch repair protein)
VGEGKANFDAIVEEPNVVVDRIEHNAQFALACFWHLCEFAQTYNVPIVVDQ